MGSSDLPKKLTLGPTNIYFLKANDGYVQIDTSLPENFKAFLDRLKTVNIDLSLIKCLVLTHSHDDHAGFAAELREQTGCTIVVHRNAVESLRQGAIINVGRFLNRQSELTMRLYNFVKRRTFEYLPVDLGPQDVVVDGDDASLLRSMGVDGEIVYTPGHTDDSISLILSNGDAFCSDVCMSNLGFLHYRPIEVSDLGQVFKSWGRIVDKGAKMIYPAHGKPFRVEELEHYLSVYSSSSA